MLSEWLVDRHPVAMIQACYIVTGALAELSEWLKEPTGSLSQALTALTSKVAVVYELSRRNQANR